MTFSLELTDHAAYILWYPGISGFLFMLQIALKRMRLQRSLYQPELSELGPGFAKPTDLHLLVQGVCGLSLTITCH